MFINLCEPISAVEKSPYSGMQYIQNQQNKKNYVFWQEARVLVYCIECSNINKLLYKNSWWKLKCVQQKRAAEWFHFIKQAQFILVTHRWGLQKGYTVLPRSSNPDHVRENLQVGPVPVVCCRLKPDPCRCRAGGSQRSRWRCWTPWGRRRPSSPGIQPPSSRCPLGFTRVEMDI